MKESIFKYLHDLFKIPSMAYQKSADEKSGSHMEIKDDRIDAGKAFDWGRTSEEYAKYRDIYPEEFYRKIVDRGLCKDGQTVLDLGTGTGVLPRNMYRYGAEWTGTDISPEQIEQAKIMAAASNMKIDFQAVSTEQLDFTGASFDVITACQCFWYFDHERVMPKLAELLKTDGSFLYSLNRGGR